MNINMGKRLDDLESKLGVGTQGICVKQYLDETRDNANAKLERWRSGKDVPDVTSYPIAGEEIVIYARQFGRLSDGSEVTREEYEEWRERDVA